MIEIEFLENGSLVDYTIEYLKMTTSIGKQITNNSLDGVLQSAFGLSKPLGDGKIREIIHIIRTNHTIYNEEKQLGWICGTHDGYYVTYNPYEIIKSIRSFEGKIRKMNLVVQKGYETLFTKTYYKQGSLFSETDSDFDEQN
jgi:hypothetical protein